MFRRLVLLAGVLAAGPAWAGNSACDTPRDDFDGLYCLNKVYQQADVDLNKAYGVLQPKLDATGKSALRSGQLTWLAARNASCSKREETGFYVNLGCATKMTIERTRFLQDRVRECVSSGCMESRLQ